MRHERQVTMRHDRQDERQVVTSIPLNGSELDAIRRLLGQLLAKQDSGGLDIAPYVHESRAQETSVEDVAMARRIVARRRLRSQFFKKPMFGEPAWDMLLALYAGSVDGPRQSVGRLSAASGSPATTALRWLDYLVKEQLVVRAASPTDGRSDFVELTDKGRSAMERYLSETTRTLT
jgi:DNA-binding MarR family transcriptional regulator